MSGMPKPPNPWEGTAIAAVIALSYLVAIGFGICFGIMYYG